MEWIRPCGTVLVLDSVRGSNVNTQGLGPQSAKVGVRSDRDKVHFSPS